MIYSSGASEYLQGLLKEYHKTKRLQEKELSSLPLGQLSKRNVDGNVNYVQLVGDKTNGQMRIGITKNQKMITALARKKYLQISLSRLEKNIPLLERFLKQHKPIDTEAILNAMTSAYQELPPAIFLPQQTDTRSWAAQTFDQSTYNPEERRHTTSTGLKVRSKSEVIIADRLDFYKVPYRYEMMLHIENQAFSPDFTIQKHGKLIYWEHCGLMNNKKYKKHHKWKLSMYEKAGIVPWDNLIVTYDDQDENLDVRIIDSEIRNKLL